MKILFVLFLLLPRLAFAAPAQIVIMEPNGVKLQAKLFLPPPGTPMLPGIVALHGCGGPMPQRDDTWAQILAGQGHAVLLPDSFGSRDKKSTCRQTTHGADAYGPRRGDALAAAQWLTAQNFTSKGGVLLLGWSDGGTTVLASLDNPPPGLIRGAVALYPACFRTLHSANWHPAAPLLILMGAADDWTPPEPCENLTQCNPGITLKLLPGAYHDFDVPNDPVHEISGLPYTKNHNGIAHAGENPAARAQALLMVPAFYATLPVH